MTANQIDKALARPASDVGSALLAAHEDQWFDRKSSRMSPKDLAPALVAFANAEGGTIAVGLHNGQVQGFEGREQRLNDFRQAPIDFTTPPVRASFEEVDCINADGNPDRLLIIRIDPSETVHETQASECFLRIGDESRKLNFAQQQELQFDKGQSQYDGHPARMATYSMLDAQLVQYYKRNMGSTRDTPSVLKARSLVTPQGALTNGGYLLFAENPSELFPHAHVRVLRFLTNERGTGARLGVEEGTDERIEGPIPYVVQKASARIEELVPKRRSLQASGTFEAMPIVPRDAWLEGLVNAVIHRSYSLSGDHIRVEIYPNRIEIESPGRFPGLANPRNPLEISRFARNPRIARVCADLRIGQELGEGIKRIFEEMRMVGLTDPVYKQSAGSVRLILVALPRIDPATAASLPSGSQRVLDILRGAGQPLGTGDIADAMGLSRPAVKTRLNALQEARLIRWIGKSTRDPRAVWELAEEW